MRLRSQADRERSPLTARASTLTNHRRMHARRSSSPRSWPRATSHWQCISIGELSTSRTRIKPTSVRSRSHPAMRKCSPIAAGLPFLSAGSMQVLPPPAARRAVALDPLGARSRYVLGMALHFARRDEEAVAAFGEAISLDPDYKGAYHFRGLAYYVLGDFQGARSSCETEPSSEARYWCLAIVYDKLGQHADAEAMLNKFQADGAGPFACATIYAQWGNTAKALEWLTTAMRLRKADLQYVKTDPLFDPLRKAPRFQAIERELKFPN